MSFQGPGFIVAIVAVCVVGWLVNNLIRARYGYPLEDEWGGKTAPPESTAIEALRAENTRLADRAERAEQRLAALETIVTDRGFDVAAQIEGLRRSEPAHLPPN